MLSKLCRMSGVTRRSIVTAATKTNGRKMELVNKGVEGTMMRITIPVIGLTQTRPLGELEEVEEEEEIEEEEVEVEEGDEEEEEDGTVEGEVGEIAEVDLLGAAETEVEVEVEAALEEEEVEEEAAAEVEDDLAIRFVAFCLFLHTSISFSPHFSVFYLIFDNSFLISYDFMAFASYIEHQHASLHFCPQLYRYRTVLCTNKNFEKTIYRVYETSYLATFFGLFMDDE
jgi:hypothetical protein